MQNQKIIVLRFSAMGDVAMVASVLKELVAQNPSVQIVMVSRKPFAPFFEGIPNLVFHAIEPKKLHKGVFGLYRLFKSLKQYNADAVADIHDNLRSRILSSFFRLAGTPIKRIDKGRQEKKELTRAVNKILIPLKQTTERYADVFRDLGLNLTLKHTLSLHKKPLPTAIKPYFTQGDKKIGISPFAQHIYKVYPLHKMEKVIEGLSVKGHQLFIFGGGPIEKQQAETWQEKYHNVSSLIGNFNLNEELAIISNLDVMLSMDSSGMHMASLMGIPVVSVWGPTHPFAGFLGYGQSINDCIQVDHPNRPNSIYGNKPCLCGVDACIDLIVPNTIIYKIEEKLQNG